MRSELEVNRAIERYADTVSRICMVQLKNAADTEDVFQEVFLKYALSSAVFETVEHEKAWIIRVALNRCRDLHRRLLRSRTAPLEEALTAPEEAPHTEVLAAVLSLPQKYREAVYLHYYEGYTAVEIGRLLHRNVNTAYTLLARAKEQLREKLGGDGYEG